MVLRVAHRSFTRRGRLGRNEHRYQSSGCTRQSPQNGVAPEMKVAGRTVRWRRRVAPREPLVPLSDARLFFYCPNLKGKETDGEEETAPHGPATHRQVPPRQLRGNLRKGPGAAEQR